MDGNTVNGRSPRGQLLEDDVYALGVTRMRRRPRRNPLDKARRFLQYKLRGFVDPERLVKQGLRLGAGVYIAPGSLIDPRHCWLISIGDESVLGPRVHILAHDASTKPHLGYTKIGEVRIGRRVFVGAGAMILPDVRIGDRAIVGAGSVVREDVPPGTVVFGNPAQVVCTTDQYLDRHRERLETGRRFGRQGFTYQGGITSGNKETLREAVRHGPVYVE